MLSDFFKGRFVCTLLHSIVRKCTKYFYTAVLHTEDDLIRLLPTLRDKYYKNKSNQNLITHKAKLTK